MKNLIYLLMTLTMFVSLAFPKNKPTLAILEFNVVNVDSGDVKILNDRFMSIAVERGAYQIITRGDMDAIMKEQKFQLSGCVTDECVVEVGQLLGAEYILRGTIGKIGKTYTIDMRIINIESSEITSTSNMDIRGEIDKLLTEGLAKIADSIFKIPTASLKVVTNPAHAMVSLQGESIGPAPQDFEELFADTSYFLTIDLEGYQSIDTLILLSKDQKKTLTLDLVEEFALLTCNGSPFGASIFLDSDSLGLLPLFNYPVQSGNSNLTVSMQSYKTFTQKVNLTIDEPLELDIILKKKTRSKAAVYSALLPGAGQLYANKYGKGIGILIGVIASGYLFNDSYQEFNKENVILDQYYDEYMQASDYETLELKRGVYDSQLEKVQSLQLQTNMLGSALGIVWTFNIADAYLWTNLLK